MKYEVLFLVFFFHEYLVVMTVYKFKQLVLHDVTTQLQMNMIKILVRVRMRVNDRQQV